MDYGLPDVSRLATGDLETLLAKLQDSDAVDPRTLAYTDIIRAELAARGPSPPPDFANPSYE